VSGRSECRRAAASSHRFEEKLRVALDWTLDLIFSKDVVRFLDVRAPMVSRPEGDPSQESKTVRPELPEPVC
jgi:hypothetical protein